MLSRRSSATNKFSGDFFDCRNCGNFIYCTLIGLVMIFFSNGDLIGGDWIDSNDE